MVAVDVQSQIDVLSTRFRCVAGDRLLDVFVKTFPVVRFENTHVDGGVQWIVRHPRVVVDLKETKDVHERIKVTLPRLCHLGGHFRYLRDDVYSTDLNHPLEHSDEGGIPRRQL